MKERKKTRKKLDMQKWKRVTILRYLDTKTKTLSYLLDTGHILCWKVACATGTNAKQPTNLQIWFINHFDYVAFLEVQQRRLLGDVVVHGTNVFPFLKNKPKDNKQSIGLNDFNHVACLIITHICILAKTVFGIFIL